MIKRNWIVKRLNTAYNIHKCTSYVHLKNVQLDIHWMSFGYPYFHSADDNPVLLWIWFRQSNRYPEYPWMYVHWISIGCLTFQGKWVNFLLFLYTIDGIQLKFIALQICKLKIQTVGKDFVISHLLRNYEEINTIIIFLLQL